MRDLDSDPHDIYIYDELQNADDADRTYDDVTLNSPTLGNLSRSQSHLSLYSHTSQRSMCPSCQDHQEVMERYKPSSDPGLLLGILLSTLLIISIALLLMDKGPHTSHALKFYYIYQIVLYSVQILCVWCVLKGLLSQRSVWYSYKSDDALLIVSFTGVFLYSGLSFTAAMSETKEAGGVAVYSAVKSGLVLIESMLQVTCIVKAFRFKPVRKGSHSDIVRQGALFLMTTNLALWLQDSFFELRSMVTTPAQTKLFGEGNWREVTVFAYPLCIFFRFHSGACLFEIWSTFKGS